MDQQHMEAQAATISEPRGDSQQMVNIKARYGVTTRRALLSKIAAEWGEETGANITLADADVILDRMLEAEYQRIEGGA